MVAQMTERDMVLRQIAEMEAKLAAASDRSQPQAPFANLQGMQRFFCGSCKLDCLQRICMRTLGRPQ